MNMNSVLHPSGCVARLYLPRKKGGRGFLSVKIEGRTLVAARSGDEIER